MEIESATGTPRALSADQATGMIVARLLSDWVSLQIAIEHGLGGADARLKERWMAQVVADFLNKESDLDASEVEDYLADILFNEFDTVIDDGTLPQVASLMLQLHRLCRQGRIQDALSQLPNERPAMPPVRAAPEEPVLGGSDADMIDEEDVEGVAQQVESMNTTTRAPHRGPHKPDDDGWVTVGKGGR